MEKSFVLKIQYVRYFMQRVVTPYLHRNTESCEIKLSLWINERESFIDNNDKDWEWISFWSIS